MGIFDKLVGLFSSNSDEKTGISEEELEPVVSLPAYKAEDDHFYNGVKCVRRYQAFCCDGGLSKSCLESVWVYSRTGYMTEFTSYTSKGNVFEHYVFEYNEKNNLTKVYLNGALQTENKYDETGVNNVEELSYGEDGFVCQKWEGAYDDSNHLISGTTYIYMDGISSVLSRSKNAYDASGNLVCSTLNYDFDASMNSRMEMQYDEKGNQISMVEYGPDDEFVRKNAYQRDEHGLVTLDSLLDVNGDVVEKYESTYDSKDNLLTWNRLDASGNVIIFSESTYKYDNKDNYIEQVNFENGAFDSAFVHEIEYYD